MDKEESAGIVRNANRSLSPTIGRGFLTWRLSHSTLRNETHMSALDRLPGHFIFNYR